jgi:hypothetical protein
MRKERYDETTADSRLSGGGLTGVYLVKTKIKNQFRKSGVKVRTLERKEYIQQ